VAESYVAIYKRNAINTGFPIVVLPDLAQVYGRFNTGDQVEIDLETGRLTLNAGTTFQAEPFSRVQMDIYLAGDLFTYGKTLGQG
jgi:3-isopropylmalate dehydratase small subunit